MSKRHLVPAEQRAGTAYFGFQVRLGDGSESEAFLAMEDFDNVEHVFRTCLSDFDYSGISTGSKKEWDEVASQLGVLSTDESNPELAEIARELREFLRLALERGQPIFLNGV